MKQKVFKVLSHVERMKNPQCQCECKVIPYKEREINVIENYKDESGRVIRRSVNKVIDKRKEFANFVVNDFCLDNLMAAGIDLRFCNVNGNVFDSVDKMVSTLDNLSDINIEK